MILLQLVQALRYETLKDPSPLSNLLIERCAENESLATKLYWYLKVETENKNKEIQRWYNSRLTKFVEKLRLDKP